jgi:hypothetical protein
MPHFFCSNDSLLKNFLLRNSSGVREFRKNDHNMSGMRPSARQLQERQPIYASNISRIGWNNLHQTHARQITKQSHSNVIDS